MLLLGKQVMGTKDFSVLQHTRLYNYLKKKIRSFVKKNISIYLYLYVEYFVSSNMCLICACVWGTVRILNTCCNKHWFIDGHVTQARWLEDKETQFWRFCWNKVKVKYFHWGSWDAEMQASQLLKDILTPQWGMSVWEHSQYMKAGAM